MICPTCRAQIGRYDWQAHNVSGSLSISWRCSNGHYGQHNKVEMIIPPMPSEPDTDEVLRQKLIS